MHTQTFDETTRCGGRHGNHARPDGTYTTIRDYHDGTIIRPATPDEVDRYEGQMECPPHPWRAHGAVDGGQYGHEGLVIYMT